MTVLATPSLRAVFLDKRTTEQGAEMGQSGKSESGSGGPAGTPVAHLCPAMVVRRPESLDRKWKVPILYNPIHGLTHFPLSSSIDTLTMLRAFSEQSHNTYVDQRLATDNGSTTTSDC